MPISFDKFARVIFKSKIMANLLVLPIPFLILLIPIVFQIIIGKISIHKKGTIKLWMISITAVLLEVIAIPLSFIISLKGQMMKGIQSLSPGILTFGFLFFFVLIFVIINQFIKNKGEKIENERLQ